jgi:UDP-N-acetylmuramyl pentapeptide phosphotransferase/UDP-N-acetylglucosamine-1-phosphate transferase
VAIIGQIFFGDLGSELAGGVTPHAAFAGASSLALWYVVGSFALVLLLSPLFKAPKAGPPRGAPAQPVLVEA